MALLRYQPGSELAEWFRKRVGTLAGRTRRIAIVAMARKLLIATERYAPNTEPVLPSFSHSATPKPCSFHLEEIATRVTAGAHAILILDQAGWHGAKELKVPSNISLMPLPPRAPELNPQENIWQTVCSLSVHRWLVHASDERGLRRIGRRRSSRTRDEPCRKIAKYLSVLIPPR